MTNFPILLNRFSGFSEQIMLGWRLLPIGGLTRIDFIEVIKNLIFGYWFHLFKRWNQYKISLRTGHFSNH